MRSLLLAALLLAGAAQEPPDPADCPDSAQPWMCGQVEHGCNRTGVRPDGATHAHHHACECRHACNEDGRPDDDTQMRNWDRHCKARCSPKNCTCPHPCQHT